MEENPLVSSNKHTEKIHFQSWTVPKQPYSVNLYNENNCVQASKTENLVPCIRASSRVDVLACVYLSPPVSLSGFSYHESKNIAFHSSLVSLETPHLAY